MGDSDREIRRKYSLADSIPVRRDFPSPEESKSEPSFFMKVAQSVGYQEWMWRSMTGRILAVIVIPPTLFGAAQWWYPKIQLGYEYAKPYIQVLAKTDLELSSDMIGFVASETQQPDYNGRLFSLNDNVIIAPQTRNIEPPASSSGVLYTHYTRLDLWRIISARYLNSALTFSSPIPVETRWLPKGAFAVYAATELLEALAMISRFLLPTSHFLAVQFSISGDAQIINPGDLAQDWGSRGADNMTRELGRKWIDDALACMLRVPSAIQSTKSNFIINLHHPDARSLKVEKIFTLSGEVTY